jgi:hypothetical protein
MEKYLFNDCSDPAKARIWLFNTSEWVSYSDFSKSYNFSLIPSAKIAAPDQDGLNGEAIQPKTRKTWLKKFLFFALIVAAGLLIYNFTKIRWEKAGTLNVIADRPANSPVVDVDSLIQTIEDTRGQKLDRITRTNFRIRNTWPDKITLKLTSDKFTNKTTNKYSNIELSIDNSTGYNLDNAIVQLNIWKKNEPDSYRVNSSDTFRFANIGYVLPVKRKLKDSYKGDSLSVSFFSIKSKVFNFCYSSEKQSNYGNNNDRWYCK